VSGPFVEVIVPQLHTTAKGYHTKQCEVPVQIKAPKPLSGNNIILLLSFKQYSPGRESPESQNYFSEGQRAAMYTYPNGPALVGNTQGKPPLHPPPYSSFLPASKTTKWHLLAPRETV